MNELFPIFLKADKINFLIVGGGKVALEKLFFLQKSSPNAKIELVAIEILPEVFELVKKFPDSKLFHRAFSVDDLADKQIVIAATNNSLLNLRLRDLADKYKFLLNVADKPEFCDFYLGGVVTRGDLKIGISTNGKSPVLAKRIRQWLEDVLPDSIEKAISLNHRFRKKQKGNFEEKVRVLNELTEGLIQK
ncbi:MAG: bifunctional precorrin-2 dehydrogenase/sirohydrochlorin ferrochelatase [Crocinitomicaceae bacterium]|nr:bifunctional precorrin-2 dehydrogenase/sirohydrochlorin ferrochelatase [Crocinitomicaceae bacterium]